MRGACSVEMSVRRTELVLGIESGCLDHLETFMSNRPYKVLYEVLCSKTICLGPLVERPLV